MVILRGYCVVDRRVGKTGGFVAEFPLRHGTSCPANRVIDYCFGFITRPMNSTLFEGMSRIRNTNG